MPPKRKYLSKAYTIDLNNVSNLAPADLPVSDAAQTALNAKQATLVSGTNIKTVGGTTLLGAGDIPAGVGNVSTVSIVTANGISGSVADATTTPAITLTLGSISPSAVTSTFTGNLTGNVTGNCSGTSGSTTGNASTATKLETGRMIGGVSFDGTGNIVPQTIESANEATDTTCFPLFVTASGTQQLQPKNNTGLTYNSNTNNLGATTFTGALVGNVTGNVSGSSGSCTGLAATATALATPRAINTVNFDGTAPITITAAAGTLTGTTLASGVTGSSLTGFGASPSFTTPHLGTPADGVLTNCTGTASGLTAGNVTNNANLTGDVTSVGNATTLTNAPVIAKVLTGYLSGAGTVAATDSILQAIQKLNGNDATNANLTGPVTSVGNATTIADSAVTYAKIQNVSATDLILGRKTAGAGVVEEIACTSAGRALIDDADASAQRTTLGLGTLATQSGTFSGTSSNVNTGDQTGIVGITGTKAQFDTACTDGNFAYQSDLTSYATQSMAAAFAIALG